MTTLRALALAIVALLAAPALADVGAAPALLTDPDDPRAGFYFREEDHAIVAYDGEGDVRQVGWASRNGVHHVVTWCGPTMNDCEGYGTFCMIHEDEAFFAPPYEADDLLWGPCVAASVSYAPGSVEVRHRAGVLDAGLVPALGDVPVPVSVLGAWTTTWAVHWTSGPVWHEGWTTVLPGAAETCDVRGSQAVPTEALHVFADCVWTPSQAVNVTQIAPETLEKDGVVYPVTGFSLVAYLVHDGFVREEAWVDCRDCV